ncbi:MAG: hypothetical protein LC122_12815 [Chitinophagales bacterium]|nr:hypothetical protein [Chitinophagales bacterium]
MTREEKIELRDRLVKFVEEKNTWEGTVSQLMRSINSRLPKNMRTVSPSYFRVRLNEVLSSVRSKGVSVKFFQTSGSNSKKMVRFTA